MASNLRVLELLKLDKIVIQDILGLSEAEHLDIYRAVVDLVRSRLDKQREPLAKKERTWIWA